MSSHAKQLNHLNSGRYVRVAIRKSLVWDKVISYQLCDFECEGREIQTLKITIFLAIYWSGNASFWPKVPKKGVLSCNFHSKSIRTIKCFNYVTFTYQKLKTLKRERLFCNFWRFGLPCHPTRCSIVFLAGQTEISTQLFLTTNFANVTAFVMENVMRNIIIITLVTIFNKFSRAFYFIKISLYLLKI